MTALLCVYETFISKGFLIQEVKLLGKRHFRFVTLDKGHLQWKLKCKFQGVWGILVL